MTITYSIGIDTITAEVLGEAERVSLAGFYTPQGTTLVRCIDCPWHDEPTTHKITAQTLESNR